MDEGDKKRRRMSTEGESVNRDRGAQNIAIDNPANFNFKIPNPSEIADLTTQEFKVVKTKLTFVDKSEGIKRFFGCGPGVHITAPRRFGKSTFMNMLETFLTIIVDEDANPISNRESSDNYNTFMNLKLGQYHGDFVKEHCGRYPVISMCLKDVRGTTKTDVLDSFKQAICRTFKQHRYLLDGSTSFKNKKIQDITTFLTFCERNRLKELSEEDVTDALKFLSEILYTHFNKKVAILIDDADVPITRGIIDNIEDETLKYLIRLLRNMLSAGLKDNDFLQCSLLSSCVRLPGVSAGAFSWELNNQYQALFLQNEYFSETYGFTRGEVHDLLEKDVFRLAKDVDGVKKWYNGYQILRKDETTIYNSWSIIRYLSHSIEEQKKHFDNYWVKSGLLCSLKKLLVNPEMRKRIDKLVKGESIAIEIAAPTVDNVLELKNTISYPQSKLNKSQVDFFLQLLLDNGLLNAVEKYYGPVVLKIPNLEIKREIQRKCYTQSLFEVSYRLKPNNIENYIKALEELLRIRTSNEDDSDEEGSEIEKFKEETTKKCEETICNLLNAVSLLFSNDAIIPVNESELHQILFYLTYNNSLFVTQSRMGVVKVSEELRDSDELKQSKRKRERGRKNECDMCVTLGTVAIIFEFKFQEAEEVENSKVALQRIIGETYFKLLDGEEYKHVRTKIYVGLCVKKNLNVTAHYLVNDTDLTNAKKVLLDVEIK